MLANEVFLEVLAVNPEWKSTKNHFCSCKPFLNLIFVKIATFENCEQGMEQRFQSLPQASEQLVVTQLNAWMCIRYLLQCSQGIIYLCEPVPSQKQNHLI